MVVSGGKTVKSWLLALVSGPLALLVKDKYTDQRWTGQLEDTAKSDTDLLTPELHHAADNSSMSTLQRVRRWYVFRYLL